jgi:hypothetical protein
VAETILMVGTRKGMVLARSRDDRRTWEVGDMQFPNDEVYSVGFDARRDTPRLFAGVRSPFWGPLLVHSDDLGTTWTEHEEAAIAFPEDANTALVRVWQIVASPTEPNVVWAGVEPHALFRSEDGGDSFSLVEGLWNHPHRPSWTPGNGGACLHTVVPHPTDAQRLLVAMSAAGVYRTEDGGATWNPANRGIQAVFLPEDQRYPEFGQCVHRVAMHPSRPERLYAQNHGGVYRSDDGGDQWDSIADGLPSDFGFPIVVHPQKPDTIFLFPVDAMGGRVPPEGKCRVYRSDDAGATWTPLDGGLPRDTYYAAVLRDAMCADDADPAGIYFGTRVGEVYATRDDGESWTQVVEHVPDVLSVRAVTVR